MARQFPVDEVATILVDGVATIPIDEVATIRRRGGHRKPLYKML